MNLHGPNNLTIKVKHGNARVYRHYGTGIESFASFWAAYDTGVLHRLSDGEDDRLNPVDMRWLADVFDKVTAEEERNKKQ